MTQDTNRISGYYINLDESEERRLSIENSIQPLGLNGVVKRFPALRGDERTSKITRSELGCFLSHKAIIDQANSSEYTLILEDDVFLPEDFKRILFGICNQNNGPKWDVLFMGQTVLFSDIDRINHLLKLKKSLNQNNEGSESEFVFLDGKDWYVWGAFAYLIHPNGLEKIKAILGEAEDEGFNAPIDMVYRGMIRLGRISSKVMFPYIAGIHPHHATTMLDRNSPLDHELHCAMVNLFVTGADISAMRDQANAALLESTFDVEAFVASQIIYRKLSAIP